MPDKVKMIHAESGRECMFGSHQINDAKRDGWDFPQAESPAIEPKKPSRKKSSISK